MNYVLSSCKLDENGCSRIWELNLTQKCWIESTLLWSVGEETGIQLSSDLQIIYCSAGLFTGLHDVLTVWIMSHTVLVWCRRLFIRLMFWVYLSVSWDTKTCPPQSTTQQTCMKSYCCLLYIQHKDGFLGPSIPNWLAVRPRSETS